MRRDLHPIKHPLSTILMNHPRVNDLSKFSELCHQRHRPVVGRSRASKPSRALRLAPLAPGAGGRPPAFCPHRFASFSDTLHHWNHTVSGVWPPALGIRSGVCPCGRVSGVSARDTALRGGPRFVRPLACGRVGCSAVWLLRTRLLWTLAYVSPCAHVVISLGTEA